MKWFRFYTEALNDPKILRLTDKEFRSWVLILCVASDNGGAVPEDDLSLLLRQPASSVARLLNGLTERGLLERACNGHVTPHNWEGRQFQSDVSTTRVKRFRNAHRNGNETPSDSDTDPDSDPER